MAAPKFNNLELELAPFGLEPLHDYELGGHHPVHLGDLLGDDGRYRAIHKLGNGGFANIWLCRGMKAWETTKYVALKVLMAEVSSTDECPELRASELRNLLPTSQDNDGITDSICLPLDHLTIHGPNGDHLCLVYPLLGPKVSLGLFHSPRDADRTLRMICFKVVQVVEFLHSHGICHGDITPSNILQHISGLDGLAEDEVLQIIGTPIRNQVIRKASTQGHDEPTQYIGEQPYLIDFGESFEASQSLEDLGTPGPYRSPELILDNAAGTGSDLWALGCTLFEIRTGRKLFNPFDDDDDTYLDEMVQVLGKLPEPWWSTTWAERKRLYKDNTDEQGRAVAAMEPKATEVGDSREESTRIRRVVHPSIAEGARSLCDKLAPGLWYLSSRGRDGDHHRAISQREMEVFADLLGKLLDYEPKRRITANVALSHEWFRL
ncbi:kinase-like domain-containing protein [Phialemonium atrogriseum]|uniref:Kinase-like domain-containing protein n=1 Tax=Phialemonium atrogriseum TaxID=1093897 RepID=A0AAJ0C0W7_9PEZI|nr:kinase-like domain-containing protein [Phialemonium atrogriseum]KAK1768084.1 kinase-like domain-containing protein [Phialemonium atrogriseum]